MKIVLPVFVACILVSAVAAAETPHVAAAPPAPPAPKVAAPRAAPPAAARLPKAVALRKTEPKAQAPKANANANANEGKTNDANGEAPPPSPRIQTRVSDPGITLRADETGTRIFVRGTAEGPELIDYMGKPTRKEADVSYQVARGVSFEVDKHEMPDFSKDPDYRRKNTWYFAHLASFSPSRGDSALRVAQALATSLSKGNAYEAKVSPTDDGAVIEIAKR